jgi:hypothetical protein
MDIEEFVNVFQMKQWIDNATYKQLLEKWRYASIGDSFFQGVISKYYVRVMLARRKLVGDKVHMQLSREIGWDKKTS